MKNNPKNRNETPPSQTVIQKSWDTQVLRNYILALVAWVMIEPGSAHYVEQFNRHIKNPYDVRPLEKILESEKRNGGFFGEQLFLDAYIKVWAEGKKCMGLTWSTYHDDHKKKIDFSWKVRLDNGNTLPCGIQFTTNPNEVDRKYEQVLVYNKHNDKNKIIWVIAIDSKVEGGMGIWEMMSRNKTPLEFLPIEKQTYWMNRVREIDTNIRTWLTSETKEFVFKDDFVSIKLKRIL